MTVNRTTFLPTGPSQGRLIVPAAVAISTRLALQGFHGVDGRHEGLVFWLGRRVSPDIIVAAAIVPDCEHSEHRVMASAKTIGGISRLARQIGLGIVAQVHSHAGDDTRHSDGDDVLVLMPFDGMFSLVVGRYGDGAITLDGGMGLHQFQKGRWTQILKSCAEAMVITPSMIGGLG